MKRLTGIQVPPDWESALLDGLGVTPRQPISRRRWLIDIVMVVVTVAIAVAALQQYFVYP